MYNLYNLNDYEFEILCKDIMEKMHGESLRTYRKGRDQGVDISCFQLKSGIIIQAKHYINSSFTSLYTALEKELVKIDKLKPKRYYVCTSRDLTRANIEKIYQLFKKYMKSTDQIIDGTQINDFLKKEENIDIINKNYKIWLSDSKLIGLMTNRDVFIDSEELMIDIERDSKLFVETNAYRESREILDKERLLIIQGDPGVGKTTISKMLVIYYATLGFKIKYSSDNSVKDLKKSLSTNIEEKELVLLDDFLGQHYLKINENRPNQIRSLIGFIKRQKNKMLIMNSRITILNEAVSSNLDFKNLLDNNHIGKYLIDLNLMKPIEKAKILYNHFYFNKLPKEYYDNIIEDRNYCKVVVHKNYNPRIIEFVSKKNNYERVKANEYYEFIKSKLDNPKDVWEDEFKNRLEPIDRIFMHTLLDSQKFSNKNNSLT